MRSLWRVFERYPKPGCAGFAVCQRVRGFPAGWQLWGPGQCKPEARTCALLRLRDCFLVGWGSRSKPFLIIARLSEVMHLRASCDNRSWCWWFPSWKISCVKEKEEEKSRHKAGSQPSVELCWSVPCPQRKLHAHSASPSSCSVLCRQDTQDKLLYTSAPSRGRELWATRGDLGKDVHFSNCWRLPNAAQTAQ